MKPQKELNFAKTLVSSYITNTAFFVRIIPTDRCNLSCSYCFQKNNDSSDMSWDLFCQVLEKAVSLEVGLMSFLGGEPMLWDHLYDALELCSKQNIMTDLTTNGTLLDDTTIQKLGSSGLDYLNISVDTRDRNSVSRKNRLFDGNIVAALSSAEKAYRMKTRMNSVIYNNNFEDIKALLELSKHRDIPISLGFIVPDMKNPGEKDIHFSEQDSDLLHEIVDYILAKKDEHYPVIDHKSYFTNVFRFLRHEQFWKCNYPTRFGWINVAPNGAIRSCTKKMDALDIDFLSLTPEKIARLKETLEESVKECNPYCYSNCAYDSAYYKANKASFVIDKFVRF